MKFENLLMPNKKYKTAISGEFDLGSDLVF
jgi:hypothetical protein